MGSLIPFPWARYSKKLSQRILTPRWANHFTDEDAADRNLRLVISESGDLESGNLIRLYWLVNEEDGHVADACYQLFGQSALIGAAETACELSVGKNYDQAGRLGADLLDKHLRDRADYPAFPAEVSAHLNLVVDAIDGLASQCRDLPLPENYVTPIDVEGALEGGYPGFIEMPLGKQLTLIRQTIDEDIRPYIELDAGGVEVLDLKDFELKIAYSGSCTSCAASTGSTLSAIQQILRAKVHPDLVVIPDLDALLQKENA